MNKTKNDFDFEDDMDSLKLFTKPTRTISRAMVRHEHYYPLTYTIENFDQSEELIRLLRTVPSGDAVRIYISTAGGDLSVSEQIVSAIIDAQQREVFVLAQCGFQVCSAGTFIALSCSDLEVSPLTQFMCHNWAQWGGYGATSHLVKDIEFSHKQSVRFMREVYSGFLTEQELEDIIEHPKDLWFDADQVVERWENLQQYREEQFNQMIEEMKAEQEALANPPAKKAPAKKKTSK